LEAITRRIKVQGFPRQNYKTLTEKVKSKNNCRYGSSGRVLA
jgi:hypothetical protein